MNSEQPKQYPFPEGQHSGDKTPTDDSRATTRLRVVGEVNLQRFLTVTKSARRKAYKIMIVASTPRQRYDV